jgi:hypothetical protein
VPDLGGFGRGLLKGALSATEKAAEKVKDAAEAASRKLHQDDDPDATQVVKTPAAATQTVENADTTPPAGTGFTAPAPPTPAAHFADPAGEPASPDEPVPADEPAPPSEPARASAPAQPDEPASPSVPVPADEHHPADEPARASVPVPADEPARASAPVPADEHHPADKPARASAPVPPDEHDPANEPALADEPEDRADESDVRELIEMFHQLLGRRRPPAGPIASEWSIGVGDFFAEHPKVPKRVRGLITRLNRFGGLSYSPQHIAFGGDGVLWEKVTELRTRHVVDYLVGDAVQQQVENLPVPWFPGRRRLLDALGQAILTVTIASAKDQLDRVDVDLLVPAEVAYRASFGRTKELNAGVLSALVLADPAVNASVLATARAQGVTVTAGGDDLLTDAGERADRIRSKIAALEKELERFSKRFGRSG